ncbi:MAG: hypothetical protein V4633_13530 [Pseudomonadota bacterium]
MADIKTKYPATSSVAVTISLASLATSSTLVGGQESTAVDNTTNLDLDHVVSGKIRTGTTPTVSKTIEVWAYASFKTVTGTPTYPDVLDGTDSAETLTSANVKAPMLRNVATMIVDATSDRDYYFAPVSIAALFGAMPKFWGIFVTHDTVAALNATGSNHVIEYERIQAQTV